MFQSSMTAANNRTRGFTLVELMIVVSIIAIIATVAVPNLVASRARSNETAVIGLLRTVSSGNTTIRNQSSIDTDGDGVGEFGWLGELSGVVPVRTTSLKLRPTALSPHLGSVNSSGVLSRNGYYIMLYLPNSTGEGMAETAANVSSIDAVMAANFFSMVAWPQVYGKSGQRTFFVNHAGEIVSTVDKNNSGLGGMPAPNCALRGVTGREINSNLVASAGQIASDGNRWKMIR